MKKNIILSLGLASAFLFGGNMESEAQVEFDLATDFNEVNKVSHTYTSFLPKNGKLEEMPAYSQSPNVHLITGEYGKSIDGYLNLTVIKAEDILNKIDVNKEFELTAFQYNAFFGPTISALSLSSDPLLDCKDKRTSKNEFFDLTEKEAKDFQSEVIVNGSIKFPDRLKNNMYKSTLTCKIIDPSLAGLNKTKEEYFQENNISEQDQKILAPIIDDLLKGFSFEQQPVVNYESMMNSKKLKDNAFIGYELKQDNEVKWSQVTDVFVLGKNGLGTEDDQNEINNNKDEWYKDIQQQIDDILGKEKPKTTANQDILANILNGGITGGIVNTDLNNGLSIQDIDFGQLKIGQDIQPVNMEAMISVRDWTGGNGWKLTAKQKETERNQSLQLAIQIENDSLINLNDTENLITSGQSQLEPTTKSGEYSAKWGTHPTVGEFNNIIEWNLTANVTE